MKKSVLIILMGNRKEAAVKVQTVLTGWGCLIKTRLGIHDGTLDNCSENGLLILEMVGTDDQHVELERKLNLIEGVSTKLVNLQVD